MKLRSTPFKIAVITQDKKWISKLRKNKYPELNQLTQFKLVLPEHAKAPLSADGAWVMKDQHEAALDTTTALHIALDQFARGDKPVVFFGLADENKLAEAFDIGVSVAHSSGEEDLRSETIASYIKFNDQGVPGIGSAVNVKSANDDLDHRVKKILEITWEWRKGHR